MNPHKFDIACVPSDTAETLEQHLRGMVDVEKNDHGRGRLRIGDDIINDVNIQLDLSTDEIYVDGAALSPEEYANALELDVKGEATYTDDDVAVPFRIVFDPAGTKALIARGWPDHTLHYTVIDRRL